MTTARRRTVAAVAATVTAIGMVSVVTDGGSASASVRIKSTVRHMAKGGYLSTFTYPDGTTISTYGAVAYQPKANSVKTSKRAMTVKKAASAGAAATTTTATVTDTVGEVVPDPSATKATALASSGTTTLTTDTELAALGAPSDIISQFSQLNHGAMPVQDPLPLSVHKASPNATISGSSSPWTAPVCISKSSDGGRIKLYGCDASYKVGTSGQVWYLEDKFLATGSVHDSAVFNPDTLTGLKFGVDYGSGNHIYHWSPTGVSSIGSCTTKTVSTTYDGTSVSETSTECPETFGLYSVGPLHFESKWDGQDDGPSGSGSRSTQGVDGVYNGASANPYMSLMWEYWYN